MSAGKRFSAWRFLKRVFMHNIGLKALALFLACHIYFSLRPKPASDGSTPEPPAPQPFQILAPAPTVLYVTNTIVTNVMSAPVVYTNYIPRIDFAPLPAPVEASPEIPGEPENPPDAPEAAEAAPGAPGTQNGPEPASADNPPKTEEGKKETEKTADA